MNREVHVRFCESAGVRFPRATHLHDRIENGRSIRALAIVDDFTRECLALHIDYSLGSADVIREFESIAFERALPQTIRF